MSKTTCIGVAAALGAAVAAQAATVTVTHTLSLDQLLDDKGTTLQFDLSSVLSAQGLQPQQVLSGALVVFGVSDASYGAGAPQPWGPYQTLSSSSYLAYYSGSCYYSTWGFSRCYYYPVYGSTTELGRSRDVLYQDAVADRMLVGLGTSQAFDTVDQHGSSTGTYGAWTYVDTVTSGLDRTVYYDRARDTYDALYGDLSVTLAMDAAALQDFATDGALQADVLMQAGQARLQGATLSVVVDDTPPVLVATTPTGPNAVPEPDSMTLVAAAALAGGLAWRRRRRGADFGADRPQPGPADGPAPRG